MNNKEIVVSIIMPIFNASKFLNEAINSVLKQTFQNYELILIDDGSTDNSYEICEMFAKNDNRIKIIHKENSGVSDTRNYGLKIAAGKYICFLDADDIFSPLFLESMLKIIDDENISLVCCDCETFEENIPFFARKNIGTIKKYEGRDKYNIIFEKYSGYAVNKIFLKKIIDDNNIKFSRDIKMCEDMLFVFEYLKFVNNAITTDNVYYFYRNINTSASKSLKNIGWFTIFNVFDELIDKQELTSEFFVKKLNFFYYYYLCMAKYRIRFLNDEKNILYWKNNIQNRFFKLKGKKMYISISERIKLFFYKNLNYLSFSYKIRK